MGFDVLHAPQQAASAVQRALVLNTSSPPSQSLFEILRATVWGLAAPASKVHVNRVLSAALPTWHLLSQRATASDESLRAELREGLSTLEDAGDLLQLSGGYWAPATARFVTLPEGAGYLLVGGVPSSLPPIEGASLQYHGPHRYLATIPRELATALPVENLASWARLPTASLHDWAREVIDSMERQAYSPTSTDAFQFYLPGSCRAGAPHFRRWSDSPGDATGPLLARRMRLWREYRLVDVRSGRIIGSCELQGVDCRRLMYALDLATGNPVTARRLPSGDQAEWLFTSELPRGEQRAFAAFGTLTIPEDRPFERRWTFARNEELALAMLRSLGIALRQDPREPSR
jgi:hypothetical protein